VSTPQDVALKDAVRGVEMFRKVKVPVRHPARILFRISADVLYGRFLAWSKTCLHSHVQTVLPHIRSSAVKVSSRSVMR
jgi:hypothetical protein